MARIHDQTRGYHPGVNLTFEVQEGAADVPRARHALSSALDRAGVSTDVATAELVLTELLTNALVHGAMPIVVHAATKQDQDTVLRLEVCDSARADVPHRVQAGPASTTGRGLFLVSTLASRWGVDPAGAGKVVWAELDSPSTDPSRTNGNSSSSSDRYAQGSASSP